MVPNREPSTELVWSGTMRPGDVMHIPRGWWHQATRTGHGDGFSLHATFGLTQRTGVDWLCPLLSGQPANIHEITTATGIDTAALANTLIEQGICPSSPQTSPKATPTCSPPHQPEHRRHLSPGGSLLS